ncbi:MAG: TonB-dependent receptor [Rikenellaceae bacterium]|nr:TonB-dependent receptor [Rikenellaceae bacterium]
MKKCVISLKIVSVLMTGNLTAVQVAAVPTAEKTIGAGIQDNGKCKISGRVTDPQGFPVAYAGVYLEGTLSGTTTDAEGLFELSVSWDGVAKLVIAFLGYQTYTLELPAGEMKELKITLHPEIRQIDQVVVTAGNYLLKTGSMLDGRNAVEIATTAGSEGDLYKSISLLPGTQVAGTDGKLLVRGGSGRESQTFIDGMHVLSPYTSSYGNVSSRGRYSPFIFEGINFSMGGHSPEYSQSLSSVLPLDTKDESPNSKIGVNLMNVSVGGGGTQAWEKGSLSADFTFTDLTFYNSVFHRYQKDIWKRPYREYALQKQLRFDVGKNAVLKTYATWSKTDFGYIQAEPLTGDTRLLDYGEENIYLNSTFRKRYDNGTAFFAGATFAGNRKKIKGGLTADDFLDAAEREIHLKVKTAHRFSNLYKLEAGAETYIQTYNFYYGAGEFFRRRLEGNITGVFFSNDFGLSRRLFLNISARGEYGSEERSFAFLPRTAVTWQLRGLTVSAVVGMYQQAADYDYRIYNDKLRMERNFQTLLGVYYYNDGRIYRIEAYDKRYGRLPVESGGTYTSKGTGHSRGIDLFFNDRTLIRGVEYIVGYSYNDSKRKYLDYPVNARPPFSMRHNASVTVKYDNWKLRSIVGLTTRYASGRPYNDPNSVGFMDGRTPHYMTVDASLTVLPSRKVILYFCASNIFNRKNIYGYNFSSLPDSRGIYRSSPVTVYQNQAFYAGIFITLGRNVAYEASHF